MFLESVPSFQDSPRSGTSDTFPSCQVMTLTSLVMEEYWIPMTMVPMKDKCKLDRARLMASEYLLTSNL